MVLALVIRQSYRDPQALKQWVSTVVIIFNHAQTLRHVMERAETDVKALKLKHDDAKLARIKEEYASGHMLSGEIKAELVAVIKPLVQRHQQARTKVTDEIVKTFMTPRKLVL